VILDFLENSKKNIIDEINAAAKILEFTNKNNSTELYGILFCHAANLVFAQRKSFELRTEAMYFGMPNFDTRQQKQLKSTVFCSTAQRKVSGFANKTNSTLRHFVRLHSEKLLNCEQKHCILFRRAAKNFGITNKSTVFRSAAQQKF
jgi:hypothetical protein